MQYSDSIDQRITDRHKKSFQFVGDLRDKVILDVGCSYGWFEKWAIENKCKEIIGIEPDVVNFNLKAGLTKKEILNFLLKKDSQIFFESWKIM